MKMHLIRWLQVEPEPDSHLPGISCGQWCSTKKEAVQRKHYLENDSCSEGVEMQTFDFPDGEALATFLNNHEFLHE